MVSTLDYREGLVIMSPGLYDPHTHPRIFDAQTDVAHSPLDEREGKAGLPVYTAAMLKAGFTLGTAMPNEFYRVLDSDTFGGTKLEQWPISNPDRAVAAEVAIQTQALLPMSYNFGLDVRQVITADGRLDREQLRYNFREGARRATSFKGWVDESTGGMNIQPSLMGEVEGIWHEEYPHRPVVIHAEDSNVKVALEYMFDNPYGRTKPIHVAHISSQEELEAVMEARARGMRVTCEVTPHHLFVTDEEVEPLGSYRLVKPSIKRRTDQKFLWDNLDHIDVIASDCAPHRVTDKEGPVVAWGVTNHTTEMALLLGAMDEGKITLAQIYEKMVINPRRIFNMPMDDGSKSVFDLTQGYVSTQEAEAEIDPQYGQNIFPKVEGLGQKFHLLGKVVEVVAGSSRAYRDERGALVCDFNTDLRHLVAAA